MLYVKKENISSAYNSYHNSNHEKKNLQWNTTKAGEHIPRGSLMSMIWTLDDIENKHDECKG